MQILIEDQDGEIVLQNVPGKGATFLVRLPIYEGEKRFRMAKTLPEYIIC